MALGCNGLLEFGFTAHLESEVHAQGKEKAVFINDELSHDRNFEQHFLDGRLVLAVIGLTLVTVVAVAEVQFGRHTEGFTERKPRHKACTEFRPEIPITGFLSKTLVYATRHADAELHAPRKALFAGAVFRRIFGNIMGSIVVFLVDIHHRHLGGIGGTVGNDAICGYLLARSRFGGGYF